MKLTVYLSICAFLIIGCKKKITIDNEWQNADLNNTVSYNSSTQKINALPIEESDYLYFQDVSTFNSTLEKLENMKEEEITQWESNFKNFQSMNNKFIQNLVLDTLHFWNKQYVENVPQNINVKHCDEIRDAKFMYVKYFFDRNINQYEEYVNEESNNEEYLLQKNISIESYAFLVNPHGIVRIGDSLYQFTRNLIKSIEYTVPGNVNKLINAKPNNSNSNNEVVFNTSNSIHSINKLTSCDYPYYFYNNSWGTSNSTTFSSNPKYKLYLNGEYRFTNDYYCKALYTPILQVYADAFKKTWYNLNWHQTLAKITIEVSGIANNPNGTVSNVYSIILNNSTWRAYNTTVFPQINSQGFSNMFSISNFYSRATMSGGSSGGITTISH